MNGDDERLEDVEALLLLTNRILMDYVSLQVSAGSLPLAKAKKLVDFSATEVKRGAPGLSKQVDHLAGVILKRFDETDYSKGPSS